MAFEVLKGPLMKKRFFYLPALLAVVAVFGTPATEAANYSLGKPFPMMCEGLLESRGDGTSYTLRIEKDDLTDDERICASATIAEENGVRYRTPRALGDKTIIRLLRSCSLGKPCRISGLMSGWSHDVWFWQRIDSISYGIAELPSRQIEPQSAPVADATPNIDWSPYADTKTFPVKPLPEAEADLRRCLDDQYARRRYPSEWRSIRGMFIGECGHQFSIYMANCWRATGEDCQPSGDRIGWEALSRSYRIH